MDEGNLILRNELIIDSVSMTASYTSAPQDISSTRSYCIQGVWTGATASSADTVIIEASLDPLEITQVYTTLATYGMSASGSFMLNFDFPSFPFLKVRYVRSTASAGTLRVRLAEKI